MAQIVIVDAAQITYLANGRARVDLHGARSVEPGAPVFNGTGCSPVVAPEFRLSDVYCTDGVVVSWE